MEKERDDLYRWIRRRGSANREQYKAHVEYSAVIFKEHGATRVVECWGDDVPNGEITSFPKAALKKNEETICFSWIEWPSKDCTSPVAVRRLQRGQFHVPAAGLRP